MNRSRVLVATWYGLALLLVLLPLLQPVVTLLPPRPEQVRWRLQAFGALSQSLLIPLAGAAVGVGTAFLLGHRAVVRALSVVAFVAGAVLIAAAGLFALDLLQYRGAVGPDLQEYYQVAGVIYFAAFILSSAFVLWIGAAAWRVSRPSRRRVRRVRVHEAAPEGRFPGGAT